MNEFLTLLSRQVASDARTLPRRARARFSDERVERCGTIAELRAAARRGVPRVMFDFVDGAANDEVTSRRNREDFAEFEIVPRVLVDVSGVDITTTVLGHPIAVPLLGAPMGLNGLVHHTGEAGIARAMHDAGTVHTLAAMASYSIEEIATEAPGPTWFQMYIWRDRGLVRELVERARAAGFIALVVTVDVPRAAGRDRDRRNGFGLPPRVTLRSLAGGGDQAAVVGAVHPPPADDHGQHRRARWRPRRPGRDHRVRQRPVRPDRRLGRPRLVPRAVAGAARGQGHPRRRRRPARASGSAPTRSSSPITAGASSTTPLRRSGRSRRSSTRSGPTPR